MKPTTTSWTVIAIGAAVSGIGYTLLPSNFGAGVLGFGLAHVVLGALDLLRPSVRQ
ncbi:MAG: hypothetical protein HPY55_07090 [Firmicutes bacterium]|nr:hypothetical protein [Bacillota bacterium]